MNRLPEFQHAVHRLNQKNVIVESDGRRPTQLFRKKKDKSVVMKEAYSILNNILEIYTLLDSYKSKYLEIERHLDSDTSIDWSFVDEQAGSFIKSCIERIYIFRKTHVQENKAARKIHLESIVSYLQKVLSQLSAMHKEQQTLRLENEKSRKITPNFLTDDYDGNESSDNEFDETGELGLQEKMVIMKENEHLLDSLLGTEKEIEQAQRSLVEISDLQSQLENYIVAQAQEIDHLYSDALDTTYTIAKGNSVINQASRYGVAWRNFLLLFFLVLSGTLLFLHWNS